MLDHERASPPGGWRYFQRETSLWIESDISENLVERIVEHRKQRGLERATWAEAWRDVIDQLCQRIGPSLCTDSESGKDFWHLKKDYSMNLDVGQAISFTFAALEALRQGKEAFVSKEEAQKRAEVCRRCPYNIKPEGCSSCFGLYAAIRAVVPEDRRFSGLDMCAACGCGLEAKVNVADSVISAGNEGRDLRFPDFCWQKKVQ